MVDNGANEIITLKVILKEIKYEVCTGFNWLMTGPTDGLL
jgi:hypothetical protein